MTTCYSYHEGASPLLLSVPHDGRMLSPDIANRMTAAGLALPDTDWHVARLYEFAKNLDANIIAADYSRYVVDLNRSSTDEVLYENRLTTGLCPDKTFSGENIYQTGRGPGREEVALRIGEYWQPYHDKIKATLERIKKQFGFALLWDAHSIPGEVPLLFDGELPDLNVGTNDGNSCRPELEAVAMQIAEQSAYSSVLNGRFRGGFITREYGAPANRVCAVQLELAQRCYMDENSLLYDADRALMLGQTIEKMLAAFVGEGEKIFRR